MDLILTPSEWNRRIFESHGIRNVAITPLGVDWEFLSPRPVAFLSIITGFGYRGSRANWRELADCFRQEFQGQDDVIFTIVSHESRQRFQYAGLRDAARMLLRDIKTHVAEKYRDPYPHVIVREQQWDLTRDELRDIYRSHDCYVSYSREGWGLPALEAMACGLEIIAANYGAPMTYLAGSPAMLFDAGRLSADNLKFEGGDLAALRGHMRSVYGKRRATRNWIKQFDWATAAERIAEVVEGRYARWLNAP
jgi:hypothetical protein